MRFVSTVVLYLFMCFSAEASCTLDDISKAKMYYKQAKIMKNKEDKITLLEKSLAQCYSAEIEANMYILKAQESEAVEMQVYYYKQAQVSISKFKDPKVLAQYQNHLNNILSTRLEKTNPTLSKIYSTKQIKEETVPKTRNYFWMMVFFSVLLAWAIVNNIRIYRKNKLS